MIKRFNPDFSLSISHELAYMRETPEGGYVEHGDYATLFSQFEALKASHDAPEQRFADVLSENAALKDVFGPGEAVVNFLSIALRHTEYDSIDLSDVVLAFKMSLPETPATYAALAAIEARGAIAAIESLIGKKKRALAEMHPDTHAYGATEVIIRNQIRDLESFANELREAK